MDQGDEARVKGKGKGKEIVVRYAGEVIEGEHEAVIRDPRKETKVKRLPPLRPHRTELLQCKYEYDANSAGPPPPTSVLILGISPLMPNQHIRRHFSVHGTITSFEPQIDKSSGGALGIVFIKYTSHEEAQKCVRSEHGKKLSIAVPGVGEGEELRVVFDGEAKLLKAVLAELDKRRRREREEKRRREKEEKEKAGHASSHLKATPTSSASQTPIHSNNPWRSGLQAVPRPQHLSARPPPLPNAHLPMRPQGTTPLAISPAPDKGSPLPNATPTGPRGGPPPPAPRVRRPPPALYRVRNMQSIKAVPPANIRPPIHLFPNGIEAGPVLPPSMRFGLDGEAPLPILPSRSPSPVSRRPGQWGRNVKKVDYDVVKAELAKNGLEHIAIDGHVASVREEDVRKFVEGFEVDQIMRDRHSWYVTFKTSDSARRASLVLNTSGRKLAHYSVTVTVRAAPKHVPTAHKTQWTDAELVEQAEKSILRDLRALLEKDVVERVVASQVRRVVLDERTKKGTRVPEAAAVDGHVPETHDALDGKYLDKTGLRGLSFRKQKKRAREEVSVTSTVEPPPPSEKVDEEGEEEIDVERPKKKPKKAALKKVVVEEKVVESEDEEPPTLVPTVTQPRKRALSEVSELEVPVKKKTKTQATEDDATVVRTKKSKKGTKDVTIATQDTTAFVDEVVHEVLPETLPYEPPSVTQLRVTPSLESRPSTPVSPTLAPAPEPIMVPAIDPIAEGICEDEEDIYFAKLALERSLFGKSAEPEPDDDAEGEAPTPFRKHVTGSARTEGYYKISHAEKSAYVAQYVSRGVLNTAATETEQAAPKPAVTSSRSNRANARRRAQGLEEINQVQRAMALSKGEAAAPDSVKYNQLQTRKKHLRFARSPIHDWGLYAMEKISRGEMVIEYVGEVIRAQVADKREKAYERQGIGSSYLFRIDEDLVVDATKKGNLGRLINHSCDPNCTAKIITISGEKKIVIYAKQDIELGSEITYDYHFPIEQDKIPCLCGSAKCRGTLN
ncbi:hypothetical protein BV20DRAFT_939690 [Pilatotrama ljubarskyi]|nr:hypothetical protein BV20DRAFT_939690 [Pilatotrama ljubarskyi]